MRFSADCAISPNDLGGVMSIANTPEKLHAVLEKWCGPFLCDCEGGFDDNCKGSELGRWWWFLMHESGRPKGLRLFIIMVDNWKM
jgi:hypothetical protein